MGLGASTAYGAYNLTGGILNIGNGSNSSGIRSVTVGLECLLNLTARPGSQHLFSHRLWNRRNRGRDIHRWNRERLIGIPLCDRRWH